MHSPRYCANPLHVPELSVLYNIMDNNKTIDHGWKSFTYIKLFELEITLVTYDKKLPE